MACPLGDVEDEMEDRGELGEPADKREVVDEASLLGSCGRTRMNCCTLH